MLAGRVIRQCSVIDAIRAALHLYAQVRVVRVSVDTRKRDLRFIVGAGRLLETPVHAGSLDHRIIRCRRYSIVNIAAAEDELHQ